MIFHRNALSIALAQQSAAAEAARRTALIRRPAAPVQAQQPGQPEKKSVAAAVIVGLLLASCTTPPQQYHTGAQHPFTLTETVAEVSLQGLRATDVDTLTADFAAARPNNGSSFTITADPSTAQRIGRILRQAGVAASDVRLVAAAQPMSLLRTDRVAGVADCAGAPQPKPLWGVASLDDGFGHDNANSALLGCAVRRNIAAMSDDPRALFGAEAWTGRDGGRAGEVMTKWGKGEATDSRQRLPAPRTATTSAEGTTEQ
jgi:pilus assembly protein CpaD